VGDIIGAILKVKYSRTNHNPGREPEGAPLNEAVALLVREKTGVPRPKRVEMLVGLRREFIEPKTGSYLDVYLA
jgi:cobalamin biosynthesis protein CobT